MIVSIDKMAVSNDLKVFKMICIPIVGPDMSSALHDIKVAKDQADLLELRLDLIKDFDLQKLLDVAEKNVIVTFRPKREGGQSEIADEKRMDVLLEAQQKGVAFIDVEWDSLAIFPGKDLSNVIASRHFFDGFPEDIETLWSSLCDLPSGIAKMAVKIDDISQNAKLFSLVQKSSKPSILIGMGEEGLISRIAGKKFGSMLTFASIDTHKESAPGQVTIDALLHLYDYHSINAETKLYGVIGNPVEHSLSPAIHNAGFLEIDWNGLYLPLKVKDPRVFFESMKDFFDGFSITIPHKESLIEHANEVDGIVYEIGAMNTLVKLENQQWFGLNSDLEAAIGSIKKAFSDGDLDNKTALVLGAGGAARALIIGLIGQGVEVTIANRTIEKGEMVAEELGAKFISLDEAVLNSSEYDIILNTTSVGMYPNVEENPLEGARFQAGQVVFDAIYNPENTKLIQSARESGATVVTGKDMFVEQGAIQFENWTQCDAPRELFYKILRSY